MEIKIKNGASKDAAFSTVQKVLDTLNIPVESIDASRPWGGFFKIDEGATQRFIDAFFQDVSTSSVKISEKLSPKILLVETGKRLSWQYHHRRAEIWKVVGGDVSVVVSNDDHQQEPQIKTSGDVIILNKGQRHRLIGNDQWGIIAEIWQHSDEQNPSNEEDIVRVEDDFGR